MTFSLVASCIHVYERERQTERQTEWSTGETEKETGETERETERGLRRGNVFNKLICRPMALN